MIDGVNREKQGADAQLTPHVSPLRLCLFKKAAVGLQSNHWKEGDESCVIKMLLHTCF